MAHRIYVASSWRNERQPAVVEALRAAGHEVYDFRHPAGGTGFSWRQVTPEPRPWSPELTRAILEHPVSIAGFNSDHGAMEWADAFVLVRPCGASAHLELGWACGAGKLAIVLQEEPDEPELMYREILATGGRLCATIDEVITALDAPGAVPAHLQRLFQGALGELLERIEQQADNLSPASRAILGGAVQRAVDSLAREYPA